MMRTLLSVFLLGLATGLAAQLRVGADAGAALGANPPQPLVLPRPAVSVFGTPPAGVATYPGTRGPAPYSLVAREVGTPTFDFAATKPYLAFFCRLELNIEEATRFPVRFRLGEVRGWQQELTRRD